jgi:hypothetical protein
LKGFCLPAHAPLSLTVISDLQQTKQHLVSLLHKRSMHFTSLTRVLPVGLLLALLSTLNPVTAHPVRPKTPLPTTLAWERLPQTALQIGLWGYWELLNKQLLKPNALLTLIDLSKPSNEQRLFVIDPARKKILLQTWVAHGSHSGTHIAKQVSNRPCSNQSSAGFFLTKETYQGKNGYSLRLQGLQKGINDQAIARGIVIHGAHYVDPNSAQKTGWVGRSQGCPAVPVAIHRQLIELIKEDHCVFIFHPSYPTNASLPLMVP